MKNKEFWKDTIYNILCEDGVVAFDKKTQEPKPCRYVDCGQCLFGEAGGCAYNFKKWLGQEHIEPILNDAEKRYLESVLYPFRDCVKSIAKNRVYMPHEYSNIIVVTYHNNNKIMTYMEFLPSERETMYIGMEPNREYTLAELGLFIEESKGANGNNGKELK